MTMQTAAWERRLHTRALAAFNSDRRDKASITDCSAIRAAYAYCAEVTQKHSRTFYLASGLLPPEKRRAARALYAFCRVTDDLVDRAQNYNYRHMTLERWRERVMSPDLHASDPVALAWVDTQVRYSIPRGYVQQLIDGVSRDLTQTRYATFDDLAEYCYGVASTVGLMVMHIVGFEGEEAVPYAVKLGVALQLTNIFRDVSEDYRAGRLYLPQEELAAYGIAEADIANGNLTCNWREFMHFQIERARRLYAEAQPGIAMLDASGRFAIAVASDLYRAILGDIEQHDYDVFTRRAHIGVWGKLSRLPGIWWRSHWTRVKDNGS